MTTYTTFGPDAAGGYFVGYPTPGAPRVLTAVVSALTKQGAVEECRRKNFEQARAAKALAADARARLRGVAR